MLAGVTAVACENEAKAPVALQESSTETITASPSHSEFRKEILEANLGDEPGPWEEILFIPFGRRPDELGFVPSNESAPLGPSSFAVVRNGFWIIDNAKSRVVRVDKQGRILESVTVEDGFRLRDIALVDGELWAILDETEGLIGRIRSAGATDQVAIHDQMLTYYPWFLFDQDRRLVTYVVGNIELEPAGIQGFLTVDKTTGNVLDILPGMPTRDHAAIYAGGFAATRGRFDVQWFRGSREQARRRVEVRIRRRNGARVATIAAPWVEARTPAGIAAFVQVSSSRGGEGGVWYLEIPAIPTGELLFERPPEGDVSSDQARHLADGPGGRVYLMVTYASGVRIFRR